jgi:hypothetical protein
MTVPSADLGVVARSQTGVLGALGDGALSR